MVVLIVVCFGVEFLCCLHLIRIVYISFDKSSDPNSFNTKKIALLDSIKNVHVRNKFYL